MKVFPVIVILIFAMTSPILGDHHDDDDDDDSSEEEEYDNSIYPLENSCKGVYDERTLNLDEGDESVKIYSIGKDSDRSFEDCHIMIYGPSNFAIVMAVERYNKSERTGTESKSLGTSEDQSESDACSSPVQVSYNREGYDQKTTLCLGSALQQKNMDTLRTLGSGNGNTEDIVYYDVFYSNTNKLSATVSHKPDSNYYYYIVFTTIRHSNYETDCGHEETLLKQDTKSYCLWNDLLCDGHVNFPSAPTPMDEGSACPNGTEFQGEYGDTYYTYYIWTKSALFWALIIIPTFGIMAVVIVLLLVQIRKCCAQRNSQRQGVTGHVNVIMVPEPTDVKDEKTASPPDYSSVAELPPAYHSLFLPTENSITNKVPITPTHVYAYVLGDETKESQKSTNA